ncbi:MAG: hypothetical protein QM831_26150 [Kofleriaceae bacterium]
MRWFLVLLAACGTEAVPAPAPTTPAPAAPLASPPPVDAAVDATVADKEDVIPELTTSPQNATTKQLIAELVAKGYTATPTKNSSETLVCKGEACACMAELRCKGGCPTLKQNLAVFDKALNHPSDDRTVDCDIAETGEICGDAFFRFEGDIHRIERHYFDANGVMIGKVDNADDYFPYCGGKARVRFMGAQPRCAKPTNVKQLCSNGKPHEPQQDPRSMLDGNLAIQ